MSELENVICRIQQLTLTQQANVLDMVMREIQQRLTTSNEQQSRMLPKRSKDAAKQNESADVDHLIDMLNDASSPMGTQMRAEFERVFGKPIRAARRGIAGGRSQHYDFEVETADGHWLKVEHKGSIQAKPIHADSKPWEQGVQFHNGGANKYSLARKYAEAWYTTYIGSGLLKERYHLTAPIPTWEEWLKGDACIQGDPKTPFGKELKRVYREAHPGKSLEKERDELVEQFIQQCTKEDADQFAAEVLPVIQDAFKDKDVWLQISGDVTADHFYFRWSPPVTITRVEDVVIERKKDIQLMVRCNDGLILHPILRWGKGQGFSNLRIDLK
jgi:hypothetical protein